MDKRNKVAQISINIMDDYTNKLYKKLYALFVTNKYLPYRELLNVINEEFDKNYDGNSLKKYDREF